MPNSSHFEKLISGVGGAVAIFCVFWITRYFENEAHTKVLLIASMGASAVLLFAVPKSPLSRPWNVVGGHVISALIGVAVHKLDIDLALGGALAAGLSITAMHYLRCLHPPGGASALIPVIGGASIEEYGFFLAIFPVGVGAVLMVIVAVVFHYSLIRKWYWLAD